MADNATGINNPEWNPKDNTGVGSMPLPADQYVEPPPTFEQELQGLINKHSKENESNTPDFILAGHISGMPAPILRDSQKKG